MTSTTPLASPAIHTAVAPAATVARSTINPPLSWRRRKTAQSSASAGTDATTPRAAMIQRSRLFRSPCRVLSRVLVSGKPMVCNRIVCIRVSLRSGPHTAEDRVW